MIQRKEICQAIDTPNYEGIIHCGPDKDIGQDKSGNKYKISLQKRELDVGLCEVNKSKGTRQGTHSNSILYLANCVKDVLQR